MSKNVIEVASLIPDARVTWALRRAEMAVVASKEDQLRPLGMPASHYALLISVHAEPGLAGAEIARRLGVTPQAVASLAARLEKRGQLERRAHPRHRHIQELHLTDSGREALSAADAVIKTIDQRIAGMMTPEELGTLTKLLHRVAEGIAS